MGVVIGMPVAPFLVLFGVVPKAKEVSSNHILIINLFKNTAGKKRRGKEKKNRGWPGKIIITNNAIQYLTSTSL